MIKSTIQLIYLSIIVGLYNSGHKPAMDEAVRLAKQTVDRNMNIFNKTGHMFEKVMDLSLLGSYTRLS